MGTLDGLMEEFQRAVDGVHDGLADLQQSGRHHDRHHGRHQPRTRTRARARRPSRNSFRVPVKVHNQIKEGQEVVKSASSTAIDIERHHGEEQQEEEEASGRRRSRPTDLRGWCRRASRLAAQCQRHLLRTLYILILFYFCFTDVY